MGRASAAEAKQASETGAGMGDYRPGDCSHEQTLRTWMITKPLPSMVLMIYEYDTWLTKIR